MSKSPHTHARHQPPRQRAPILIATLMAVLATVLASPIAWAQSCTKQQLGEAIDRAGAVLRAASAETTPRIDAKMRQLKDARGWSATEYEERALATVQDDRVAKLDATANELLAKIDTLSASASGDTGAAAECSRVTEIEAVSLELQATIKAKSAYVLTRLDAAITSAKSGTTAPSPAASAPAVSTQLPTKAPDTKNPAPKAGWATAVKEAPKAAPAPKVAANVQPPPASPPQAAAAPPVETPPPQAQPQTEGYAIDEIVAASSGVFGKVSANLGAVLEHAFSTSGRPTGYILGQETGGAFLAGLRYGQGTLYLRSGQQLPIFWHGPSLGADFGASGAQVLFLVYKVQTPEDLFTAFTGVEGSAYVVGGLGLTFMSNGRIQMAPIRAGVGLRLGANIGYIRFTPRQTWNPF